MIVLNSQINLSLKTQPKSAKCSAVYLNGGTVKREEGCVTKLDSFLATKSEIICLCTHFLSV